MAKKVYSPAMRKKIRGAMAVVRENGIGPANKMSSGDRKKTKAFLKALRSKDAGKVDAAIKKLK